MTAADHARALITQAARIGNERFLLDVELADAAAWVGDDPARIVELLTAIAETVGPLVSAYAEVLHRLIVTNFDVDVDCEAVNRQSAEIIDRSTARTNSVVRHYRSRPP